MKKTVTIIFLIACSKFSLAQSELPSTQSTYQQAIGLKFPGGFSVTYKKFVTTLNNIEAQATVWNKGFRVSGLYEFNFTLLTV